MRTVREEPKFREQIDSLAIDYQRLDEVIWGVQQALCLKPETFPTVAGVISVLKTEIYPGAPALRIFFTYTATEIHFLAVDFVEGE